MAATMTLDKPELVRPTSLLRDPVLKNFVMDFPVPKNEIVCEGHAEVCRRAGHADWTVDGRVLSICPRCAAVKTTTDAS